MSIVAGIFFIIYVPFLFVSRPLFIYSSIPLLPFAFLAVGWGVERFAGRFASGAGIAMIAWSLVLYPLVVGIAVPVNVYLPILNMIRIVGMG